MSLPDDLDSQLTPSTILTLALAWVPGAESQLTPVQMAA